MNQYLHVFVKVVEKENFSKAGIELHMTQPAVSQHIRVLEELVGARLLERSNKYVRLSKAGEIVYNYAKEILALYTKMQSAVDDLTNQAKGTLAIGASYTFGEYILPQIIARIQKKFPLISPSIKIHNTKEIIELVKTHQLDAGIIEGIFDDAKLQVEVITGDQMFIVACLDHPLLNEQKEINFSELAQETWIVREEGSGTRQASDNLFSMNNFTPKKIMEFGSIQLIKESVEAGLGISLLSSWTIKKELTNGYIGVLPVKGLPFKRNFSIITQTLYSTKAVKVLVDECLAPLT